MAIVLVTGAAGAIGTPVAAALKAAGHDVRGFDLRAAEHVTHVGDLIDPAAVDAAVDGADAVVHLAAQPDEADFVTELVPPNVIGLYRVFDACQRLNVRKLAVASSIRVSGRPAGDGPVTAEGAAPRDLYALTKLWAEDMAEMHARMQGFGVIAVRIGWLPRDAGGAAFLASRNGQNAYLSHDDAGRFFTAAVAALLRGLDGYHVVHAMSRPYDEQARTDREAARQLLGYEAQDRFPEGLGFPFDSASD